MYQEAELWPNLFDIFNFNNRCAPTLFIEWMAGHLPSLRGWSDTPVYLDAAGVPDAVLLQAAPRHAAVRGAPGSVEDLPVPAIMPVILARMALVVNRDHVPHVDLHPEHHPF